MSRVRLAKLKPMAAVEIEWDDSATTSGWQRADRFDASPTACRTVGYLARVTETYLSVVQNRHDMTAASMKDAADMWGEAMSIPLSVVRRVRTLK